MGHKMLKKLAGDVPALYKAGTQTTQQLISSPVREKRWSATNRSVERPGSRVRRQLLSNEDLERIEDLVVAGARENAAQTLIELYGLLTAKKTGNGFLPADSQMRPRT